MLKAGDKLYSFVDGKMKTEVFARQNEDGSYDVRWSQFATARVDQRLWFATPKEAYEDHLRFLRRNEQRLIRRLQATADALKIEQDEIRQIEQLIA